VLSLTIAIVAHTARAQSDDAKAYVYPTLGGSELGFRHFSGRRYVTVVPTRVQREPNSTSHILADIPRLHVVYAVATSDKSWLAVRGAGTTAYPDFEEATSFVDFTDGHLVLPQLQDSGPYASLVGYIPRSAVIDLDDATDTAPAFPGLQPVPALWEKLGLREPRSFATDLDSHPFDAIGRLSSRSGYCTAFFVARDVVVTAGHCIPPNPPYDLTVTVDRGRRDHGERARDVVSGALVDARRLTDKRAIGDDWAVINLRRAPKVPITPLHFHRGDAFDGRASVKVTVVGFPADLRAVSEKSLGFNAPVVSSCVAILPEARAFRSGDTERMALRLHAPCITFPGESGGPLLIWSAARNRYEVTGITSTYRDHDAITPVFSLSTSATVRSFATGLANQYGVPPVESGFGFSATLREDTPGAALLSGMLPTFGSAQPWANFPLSTSLALAVGRATGHVPKMPVAGLMQPGAAIRHSGADASRSFTPAELVRARELCAQQCTRAALDVGRQDRATIGLRMSAPSSDVTELAVAGGLRWRVAGGDLFGVDPASGLVHTVVRDVMNLTGAGEDAAWDSRMTCRCAKVSRVASGAPVSDSAPAELPGATIRTAREVFEMRSDASAEAAVGDIKVLAADISLLRVPGSVDAAFAAAELTDPVEQGRVQDRLHDLLGDDLARPVIVYGSQAGAHSSFDLASRLVKLGYKNVAWLREGLTGWAGSGLELSLQPD
jgi:V8-like Glu-specific endopeptidase/rhodanese-related sulfurtransferase